MKSGRRVLIVGGGTAGWLTAAYLARAFAIAGRPWRVTLLESPEIGIVGVGEGTFPTIRETLRFLGVDEAAFVRDAGATFKQGVRFVDWLHAPGPDGRRHSYLHPFEPPLDDVAALVPHWLRLPAADRPPFAEAVTIQDRVAAAKRAPKLPGEGDYAGPLSYAYHFDAVRLSHVLAERARALGVEHLTGRLRHVALGDDGAIARLDTDAGALTADLYVDCSGFRAELIGGALAAPFRPATDVLFADRALTLRVPYPRADAPIESATLATAHAAGWIWDIGLAGGRGVGCVYSSRHMDDAAAADVLAAYLGPAADVAAARRIEFQAGWRERQWIGNCVAVGLAGGFLEPLEATGVVLIEAAAAMIAEFLPDDGPVDAPAARFDAQMTSRYAAIVDFLKLHYHLSRRTERFWRDNADPATVPPRLAALLKEWRRRPPSRFDAAPGVDPFAAFNYQYVLYGMEYPTELAGVGDAAAARRLFDRVRALGERASRDLPPHRMLVERLAAAPVNRARTAS